MKSAYELAMERLAQSGDEPTKPLTDEQKKELAAIDQKFDAKIAEKEVFLAKQIADAQAKGDRTSLEQLETQLRNERERLNEDREAAKNKVREA